MQNQIHHLDIYPNYGKKAEARKHSLKSQLIYKIVPLHTYLPFRQEFCMAWIRFRSRNISKQYKNAKDLLEAVS